MKGGSMRGPTNVPKALFDAQPARIKALLKDWEVLHAKGEKKTVADLKALKRVRGKLRAEGFRLSSIEDGAVASPAPVAAGEPEMIVTTFKLPKERHRRLSFAVIDPDSTARELVRK